MSKKANELLLELLAFRVDAAGAHCSDPEPKPEEPEEPEEDEPCEPDDDKGGTKIRFL